MHYTCVPQYSELGVGVPYLDDSLTCACLYIAASQMFYHKHFMHINPYLDNSLTFARLYITVSQMFDVVGAMCV